jgi:predicted DNA-binding transcriptional regulator AlpA
MQRDRILRPREVSNTTNLSLSTLQRYRLQGVGPTFVRVGFRAVGYFESDIVRWPEARRNLGEERRAQ